jgi:hypothetical protein
MKTILRLTTSLIVLFFLGGNVWGQLSEGFEASLPTGYTASTTYTWIGADNESWAVPGNWNPTRTPANDDILQFNDGSTKTVTSVPTETIGKLSVTGNTNVTFQTGSATTLTISNGTGDDLVVASGSQLNISGAIALSISLSTGATGSVSGAMTFAAGAHKLLAADAAGITFNNGAVFTTGDSFSESAFGTKEFNSVVFASGSAYIHNSGTNPFAVAVPNSIVVFQRGSLYIHKASTAPAFSGRTYADFEYDHNGSPNAVGSSSVSIDNLKITQGTFKFNVTGTPGHSIKGNIEIMTGATLSFSPSGAGTVNLNGTSLQTISGGGTLSAGSLSTLVINNPAGVKLNGSASFNNLTTMSGSFFDILPGASCTVGGTLTNNVGAAGLVIKSDGSGTGSLIHSTTGVSGTVERYIEAADWVTWDDGWHSLSSPVAAQALSDFITTGAGNDYDIYGWDEPTNFWMNYKDGGFVTWNGGSNFNVGQGYLVAYEQTQTGKSFSGNLNVADVSISGLALSSGINKGWHLLGNPFASALTWYTDWTTTNIGGVANIWNEAGKSYTSRNAGDPIPSGNGFMVQVTTAPGSLTIPAAKRVHSSQAWYKNSDYPVIQLFAHDLTDQSFQESQIRVNPESTFAFEAALDGNFLPGYAPLFYSVSDGHNLMVNSLPELTAETTIPFHFIKSEGTSFSIEAIGLETLEPLAVVFLRDIKLGIDYNLTENPVYTFTSAEGDDPARFELKFGAVGINDPATASSINAWYNAGTLYVANKTGLTNISVFNVQGQQVQQARVQGNGLQTISIQLPAGVYIAQLVNNGSSQTVKLIVQ